MNFKTQVILAFTAVYLIWGSTYLAIRFTVETLPLFLTAGFRFMTAGLIMYIYARYGKKESPPIQAHWRSACIIGGFLLLGGNGSVVWAEQFVPSGIAALFGATTPLWMLLIQWLWTGEKKPTLGIMAGVIFGMFGVWFLIAPGLFNARSHSIHMGGAFALLFAAFSWAIGSVYSRKAILPRSPFLSTGMQMIAGGVFLFLFGCVRGEIFLIHPTNFSLKSIGALAYLILFGSLIGFTSYIWLIKNVGIARTSTYAFVNPMVAVFLGWALAGEKLTFQTMLAALFIIIAVILVTIFHTREVLEEKSN